MQYQLNANHLHHLITERGLNTEWVQKNCGSVSAEEATLLLGYPIKSDGIWLNGYNEVAQLRCNKPWKNDGEKKAPRYRSQLGEYDAMLPVSPIHPNMWDNLELLKTLCFKVNNVPILLLTEGFFKAIALSSIGYPCIALQGVEMGLTSGKADPQKRRYLVPKLEFYARAGFGFLLLFDADCVNNEFVLWAERKLHDQLQKFSVATYSLSGTWDEVLDGKGIDDYLKKNGVEAFKELINTQVLTYEEWSYIYFFDKQQEAKSKLVQSYKKIEAEWGDKIKYNLRTKEIELNRNLINLDTLKLDVALQFDLDLPQEDCEKIVLKIAHKNEYHPIQDYLESVYQKYGTDTSILSGIAARYFGVSDEIYETYLIKTLVGAVARIFRPGIKFDTCLILQGRQGCRKSTFFRVLFSDEYFCESQFQGTEKDELLKLHQNWAIELAEIEAVFSRKESAQLKNFLSTPTDIFRKPYGRKAEKNPRQFILLGSTNSDEFLYDPTGERRYLVVPVAKGKNIPIELLEEERDRIWAAAVHLFKTGYSISLDHSDQVKSNLENERWSSFDPWEDTVLSWLKKDGNSRLEFLPTQTLLSYAIGLLDKDQSSQHARRLKTVMLRLGWKPDRQRLDGIPIRGFSRATADPDGDPDGIPNNHPSGSPSGTAGTQSQSTIQPLVRSQDQQNRYQLAHTSGSPSGTAETQSQQPFQTSDPDDPAKNPKNFSQNHSTNISGDKKEKNVGKSSGSSGSSGSTLINDGMAGGFCVGDRIEHKKHKGLSECRLDQYLGQGQWMATCLCDGEAQKKQLGVYGMVLVKEEESDPDQPSLFDEAQHFAELDRYSELLEWRNKALDQAKSEEEKLQIKIRFLELVIENSSDAEEIKTKEQEKAKLESELSYLTVVCKPLPSDAPIFCKWVSSKVNPESLISYVQQLLNPNFPQFANSSNARYLASLINSYCGDNAELKQQIWTGLSEEHKSQFKALLR